MQCLAVYTIHASRIHQAGHVTDRCEGQKPVCRVYIPAACRKPPQVRGSTESSRGFTGAVIGQSLIKSRELKPTPIVTLHTVQRLRHLVFDKCHLYPTTLQTLGSVDKRPFQTGLDVIEHWSLRRPVDAWRPDGRGMGNHWRTSAA